MAFLVFIFHRIKSVFLIFVGLWRRALCCLKRKRRPSCDMCPLTAVDVISDSQMPTKQNENDMHNWNNWEEENKISRKPNTVQEHIEFYRQTVAARQSSQDEEEVAPNYFEDMTPKFTGQTKIVINKRHDEPRSQTVNRLSLVPEMLDTINGGQLGEWQESVWENEGVENTEVDSMLREKRRQEREKRRQQKVARSFAHSFATTRVNT